MLERMYTARLVPTIALVLIVSGCGGSNNNASSTNDQSAASNANTSSKPVDPATAATVTGTITFDGPAPPRTPIKMSADPNCERGGQQQTTEAMVVGDGGSLQNVFVYVKDGLGNAKFPAPSAPVVLNQKGCHYEPHVFGVQVGQPVEIINSDPTLHNVHGVAKANSEFNAGQPIQGMKFTHTFSTTEVMVPFKCDVHGWMNAYAGVLDHPYFSVTGTDGTFTLKGLPPGTYTIEAWHEKLGTQTQSVTVGEKETKNVAFTFKNAA